MSKSRITKGAGVEQIGERLRQIIGDPATRERRERFLNFVEEVRQVAEESALGPSGFGMDALELEDEDGRKLRDVLVAYMEQYEPGLCASRKMNQFLLSIKAFRDPSDKQLVAVLNTLRRFEANPTPGEYPPLTLEELAEDVKAQDAAIESLRRTMRWLEHRIDGTMPVRGSS